ncbi:hypothetical protein C5E51_34900 [Nocardia nova]|nr:hypothetical protein C5E51_34900 [Nocardia nova]PPJ21287.1 hypothetical protein C5E44_06920 [Nocardia nova]
MEDWAEIRRLYRSEGVSISEIARRLGIARNRPGLRRFETAASAQDWVGIDRRTEKKGLAPWCAAVGGPSWACLASTSHPSMWSTECQFSPE